MSITSIPSNKLYCGKGKYLVYSSEIITQFCLFDLLSLPSFSHKLFNGALKKLLIVSYHHYLHFLNQSVRSFSFTRFFLFSSYPNPPHIPYSSKEITFAGSHICTLGPSLVRTVGTVRVEIGHQTKNVKWCLWFIFLLFSTLVTKNISCCLVCDLTSRLVFAHSHKYLHI